MTKLELAKATIKNINKIKEEKAAIVKLKEECLEKYIEFDLQHEEKFLVEVEKYLVDIITEEFTRMEDREDTYETQISIPVNYSTSEWVELQNTKALEEKNYMSELISEESPF